MSIRWTWTTLCALCASMLLSLSGCQHYHVWGHGPACDECCDGMTYMPYQPETMETPHEAVPSKTPQKAPLPAPTPDDAPILQPTLQQLSTSHSVVAEPVESQQSLVPNRPRILTRINQTFQDAIARPVSSESASKGETEADSQPVQLELGEDAKSGPPVINVSITVLPQPFEAAPTAGGSYQTVASTNGHSSVPRYAPQPAPQAVPGSWSAPAGPFGESGIEMWPHRPVVTNQPAAPAHTVVTNVPAVEEDDDAQPVSFTIVPRVGDEPQSTPSLNPLSVPSLNPLLD